MSYLRTMKQAFPLLFLFTLLITACDPGHLGDTYITNESSQVLELKYTKHGGKDSTIIIPAYSIRKVYHFGGLGAGRDYDCCPCEFAGLTLQPLDTNFTMTKNVMEQANWKMTNENKKKFSDHEDIKCEFTVTQSDIH